MKIKRIIMLILSMAIVFTTIPAYAQSLNEDNSGLHIYSRVCPDDYIEYVENNIYSYIDVEADNSYSKYDCVTVGLPFTFLNDGSQMYYFPVYSDDTLISLLRVYEDDGIITGVISSFLCD